MKKRILISDIARDLGISVTTVSFILNDKSKEKRISEALTKKVLSHIKKVGYKPNQLAKSLRTGQTKMLGLLVEDIGNTFFANMAKLIEKSAYNHGYHISYCSTDNDETKTKELIQLFYDRQVDGFILTPSEGLEETVQKLINNNIPLVLIDRYLTEVDTSYVVSDNFKGAYDATKHLLADQGKSKKVGFISLYSNQTQMRDRLDGYMKAIDDHKNQAYIKKINMDEEDEEAVSLIHDFLLEHKLDAVLFATNYLAILGLKTIKKYNLKYPEIFSFDDHTLFSLHEPPISVVSQDIHALSAETISCLIKEIGNKNKQSNKVVVPCALKIRA